MPHRPARTETFDHTISGLLAKRADLFAEAERIRDRLAEIKNDIGAIDRVLGTLGYAGDLDATMPRQKREVIFGRGEMIRGILAELRHAEGPLSSREIAQNLIEKEECHLCRSGRKALGYRGERDGTEHP